MFSEKRKFAYKLETVHSVLMLYKKIFEEIKDTDRIVLTQCPCHEAFYDCEAYRSLAKDKIFLRKAIEKKYENSNFNGLTFRHFS